MEFVLTGVLLCLAAAILTLRTGPVGRLCRIAAGVCVGVVGLTWGVRDLSGDPSLVQALPERLAPEEFVSSATCQACHPGEHDSWHRSFHRSMTQPATAATVLGDFDDVELENKGYVVRLSRRGDEFWVDMTDPMWFAPGRPSVERPAPRIRTRVVMTTGSHHMQVYWVRRPSSESVFLGPDDGSMQQLPFVWLIDKKRWVPTEDTFLGPPTVVPETMLRWNESCNMCHSVGTQPQISREGFATKSAELGIACEACHGPGAAHVAAMQSPLARYRRHLTDADVAEPTIVNPARLDKERSAEVCGQCHSFNKELDMSRWSKTGVAYRAGDVLGETKAVFKYTENPTHPRLLAHLEHEPNALQGRFWKDGTMRVAGREYNGLIESACYTKGEMTCLTCHSMHSYREPKDQLRSDVTTDQACMKCHETIARDVAAHTRHGVDSVGSQCVNCHMPHTSYGLLAALRSHRVDSPSAAVTAKTGRPNACNICHLDKTLAWTATTLTEWFGHAPVDLTNRQRKVAASIAWVTNGDAAQRAIGAWAMGWPPAQQASGKTWQGAFLSQLLDDSYSVVREVAHRSIRTMPGFAGFQYDYVAPRPQRLVKLQGAVALWRENGGRAPDRSGPHMLMDAAGKIDTERFNRLVRLRDNTPIRIIE